MERVEVAQQSSGGGGSSGGGVGLTAWVECDQSKGRRWSPRRARRRHVVVRRRRRRLVSFLDLP